MRPIITILISLFFFTSCRSKEEDPKPVDKVPPHTQNGENILSCKVDGVWHNYSGIPSYMDDDGVRYYKWESGGEKYVSISGDKTSYNDEVTIYVYTQDIEVGKVYKLSSETSKNHAVYRFDDDGYSSVSIQAK